MAEPDAAPAGIGAHLKAALVGAHEHVADAIDARKAAHVTNLLEQLEADLKPYLGPIISEILNNPAIPDHMRPLIGQAGAPDHQFASLVVGIAVGAIIGPVFGAATQPFLQNIENEAWAVNPSRPLSPDLVAASVLKAVLTEGNAANEAHLSGIDAGRFHTMVETAGNSLGISELLLLWRRGQISDAELDAGLAYSNLNPKFYADAKLLRYLPPPAAEVITGALKGHLTEADARVRLGEAGIDPNNFQWLFDTAGRPPGTMQMLELWNRGEIDQARVEQSIRQSDVNTDYIPDVLALRWYLPPVRSVIAMMRSGAIDDTRGEQLLRENGVRPEDIAGYVAESHHTATSSAKALTQSQIIASYEARLIDRPTAQARLEALKYEVADAGMLLDLADEKRAMALQNAGARAIGSKYVAHHLTKQEASDALAALKIPNAAQLDLFTVWDVERTANQHLPTAATIMHLYRQGLNTATNTKRRLLALGIDANDLPYFVGAGYPPSPKGATEADAAIVAILGA